MRHASLYEHLESLTQIYNNFYEYEHAFLVVFKTFYASFYKVFKFLCPFLLMSKV